MLLIVLIAGLSVLRFFEIGPFASLSWWWIAALFVAAFVWFEYIEKMLGAIIGIEITISRLVGKWKVSQNQPAANQASLIAAFKETGNPMAELIQAQQQ